MTILYIKIHYRDNSMEFFAGIIDNDKRIIRYFSEEGEEKGIIPFENIKKIEIIKKIKDE